MAFSLLGPSGLLTAPEFWTEGDFTNDEAKANRFTRTAIAERVAVEWKRREKIDLVIVKNKTLEHRTTGPEGSEVHSGDSGMSTRMDLAAVRPGWLF